MCNLSLVYKTDSTTVFHYPFSVYLALTAQQQLINSFGQLLHCSKFLVM